MSWLTRVQVPFMKYATVYNFPRFWVKYLTTDLLQMYLRGDVPPLAIPFRIAQGARIKTRKGYHLLTDAVGNRYRIGAKYFDDAFQQPGCQYQSIA